MSEVKQYHYIMKFNSPNEKWRDITEDTVRILFHGFFSPTEMDAKIKELQRGERVKTLSATFEAYEECKGACNN